jgi:catechol 2,3-dioxygenase-like lactoylglutathione lyase family enzyme
MYISVVSVLVNDVDRAVDFYCDKLGWEKTMDVPMGENDRWVTVAPSNERTSFTLTKGGPMWSPEKVGGFSGVIIAKARRGVRRGAADGTVGRLRHVYRFRRQYARHPLTGERMN